MRQVKSEHSDNVQVIPIVEEVLDVQKRQVKTGGVRISKTVREQEEHIAEPVWQEEVSVERVAINRVVDGPVPTVRTEGDVMIVPLLEETLVVRKQLMLKEELRITKRRIAEQSSRKMILRREEARVERVEPLNQQEQGEDLPRNQKGA
jgi:uncharacterized protein (TIGR02271 family)